MLRLEQVTNQFMRRYSFFLCNVDYFGFSYIPLFHDVTNGNFKRFSAFSWSQSISMVNIIKHLSFCNK